MTDIPPNAQKTVDPGPGVCRVCGCTDDDCSQCVEKTGEPCHWVEPDLCSACQDEAYPPQEYLQP